MKRRPGHTPALAELHLDYNGAAGAAIGSLYTALSLGHVPSLRFLGVAGEEFESEADRKSLTPLAELMLSNQTRFFLSGELVCLERC